MTWEQDSAKPPIVPRNQFASFLWSPRGRLTKVTSPLEAKKLLQGRWKRPTDEELSRYRVGGYSPLYDLGEKPPEEVTSGPVIQTKPVGEFLDVVEA